jgi:DNA-binding HxlR family transcriptional regulator
MMEFMKKIQTRNEMRSGCPINLTLEMLGDRWSLIVIRDIMFGNRRHYGDLLRLSEEGIASNILANRLARLVQSGLLLRTDDPTHKQKAIYSLTEASIQLGLLLRPGNSRSAPSFLKKAASECGRHSWPSSEAFTWERPCRAGRSAPNFKPLLSLQLVAKPMLQQALRLDSIASGTGQALGCTVTEQ